MNKKDLIKEIKKLAQNDKDLRRDQRYLNTMGFLVAKTFRFKPETVDKLKSLKNQTGQSETEILENLIADAKSVDKQGARSYPEIRNNPQVDRQL